MSTVYPQRISSLLAVGLATPLLHAGLSDLAA